MPRTADSHQSEDFMLISEAVIHLGLRSVDARLTTDILLDHSQPHSIIANYSREMTERLR